MQEAEETFLYVYKTVTRSNTRCEHDRVSTEADRLVYFIVASIGCCDVRPVRSHLHVSTWRWRGKVRLRMSLSFQFVTRCFAAMCQQMIDKLIHVPFLRDAYLNRRERERKPRSHRVFHLVLLVVRQRARTNSMLNATASLLCESIVVLRY